MKNWRRQITNFIPLVAIGAIALIINTKFTNSSSNTKVLNIPQNRELPSSEVWQVVKVSDGDTITVSRGMEKQKVRFACIDAPEKAQPLGTESKANLQRLIDSAGGRVLISVVDTDRYGRKVAEVFTSNNGVETFLQEEQLKAGLAYVYEQYISDCLNVESVRSAQEIAIASSAGVWAGNNIKPWDYRKAKR